MTIKIVEQIAICDFCGSECIGYPKGRNIRSIMPDHMWPSFHMSIENFVMVDISNFDICDICEEKPIRLLISNLKDVLEKKRLEIIRERNKLK